MTAWNKDQLFSSKSIEWATPDDLFEALDEEFSFDLDAAASVSNNRCPHFMDVEIDSLASSWAQPGLVKDASGRIVSAPNVRTIFLNPPWGRTISAWLEKAFLESRHKGITVVCLIPACTDTRWFKNYVWKAAEVRLITGRPKFVREDGHTGPSPKGACLAIFTSWSEGPPNVRLV